MTVPPRRGRLSNSELASQNENCHLDFFLRHRFV